MTNEKITAEIVRDYFSAPVAKCENCGDWTGNPEDVGGLAGVRDLLQRVEPGEPMPACECPECGALCHLEQDDAEKLLAVIDSACNDLSALWRAKTRRHGEPVHVRHIRSAVADGRAWWTDNAPLPDAGGRA